jgi:hypothetical protein
MIMNAIIIDIETNRIISTTIDPNKKLLHYNICKAMECKQLTPPQIMNDNVMIFRDYETQHQNSPVKAIFKSKMLSRPVKIRKKALILGASAKDLKGFIQWV